MHHRLGHVPLLAALALAVPLSGAARAQAPPPAAVDKADVATAAVPAAADFPLEDVRVEGLDRASPRVVLAASLLEPGGRYDEEELARAVARVERLPFVLDARFRLEKGSERGLYVLVVEVVETRRFFFGADVSTVAYGRTLQLDRFSGGDSDFRLVTLAGIRQSIGSAGEVTASLATEEGFQAAYTHYDLFGRGAVGGVAVAKGFCCGSVVLPLGLLPELSHFHLRDPESVQAHLAVPIAGDHAWRATAAWTRARRATIQPVLLHDDTLFVQADDVERRALGLDWTFDDTDDPLLADRGRRLSAGLERLEVEYRPLGTFAPGNTGPVLDGREVGSDLTRAHASGRWFLPLSLRQTLSFQARAAVGVGEAEWVRPRGVESADITATELSAGVGHTLRLWRSPPEDPRPAELWVESGLEAGWETTDRGRALPNNPILRVAADLGIAYRNTWGLFRFVLGYRDLPEVD